MFDKPVIGAQKNQSNLLKIKSVIEIETKFEITNIKTKILVENLINLLKNA